MNISFRHPWRQVLVHLSLLGSVCIPAGAMAAGADEQELRVRGQQHLELRNFIGSVRVGEASGAEYVIRVRANRPGIVAEPRDGGRRVVVRWPQDIDTVHSPLAPELGNWIVKAKASYDGHRYQLKHGPADYTAEVTVWVPRGARLAVQQQLGPIEATAVRAGLRLETANGGVRVERSRGGLVAVSGASDISVRGHEGEVKADTGSGNILLETVIGRQAADTGSGSVRVRDGVGELLADTGSGDVLVERHAGDVKADTGSGSVRVTDLRGVRRLDADTGSGEVTVQGDLGAVEVLDIDTGSGSVSLESSTVPSLTLEVDTGSGEVSARGAARVEHAGDRRTVVIGAGVHRGRIDTGSGDIRVVVAAQP